MSDTAEHQVIDLATFRARSAGHPAGSSGPPTEPVRFDCGAASSSHADYGWPTGEPDSGLIDWDADERWPAVAGLSPLDALAPRLGSGRKP